MPKKYFRTFCRNVLEAKSSGCQPARCVAQRESIAWDSTGLSGFLPLSANMPVGQMATLNCPQWCVFVAHALHSQDWPWINNVDVDQDKQCRWMDG